MSRDLPHLCLCVLPRTVKPQLWVLTLSSNSSRVALVSSSLQHEWQQLVPKGVRGLSWQLLREVSECGQMFSGSQHDHDSACVSCYLFKYQFNYQNVGVSWRAGSVGKVLRRYEGSRAIQRTHFRKPGMAMLITPVLGGRNGKILTGQSA